MSASELIPVDVNLPSAARLAELAHPCLPRFVDDDGALFVEDLGPSVSLLTLADVASTPRGRLEPEILACILGRAGLGIAELYRLMVPPLRTVEAEGVRLFKDGQVRFDPLPYLRAADVHDERPFQGALVGSAPSAPYAMRPMGIDAYALIMLFYELVSDASVRPFDERPERIDEVSRQMLLWGARTEADLGGVFRGLLEEEFDRLERDLVLFEDELDEPELEARVRVDELDLDKHLVTCARYARFCRETGHAPPGHWVSRDCPRGLEAVAVTGVGHRDARAFALHVGGRLLRTNEWQRLCAGRFPSGDQYVDKGSSRAWLEQAAIRTPRPLREQNLNRGVANLCELWEWTHEGNIVGGPVADGFAPGMATNRAVERNPRPDLGFRVVFVD